MNSGIPSTLKCYNSYLFNLLLIFTHSAPSTLASLLFLEGTGHAAIQDFCVCSLNFETPSMACLFIDLRSLFKFQLGPGLPWPSDLKLQFSPSSPFLSAFSLLHFLLYFLSVSPSNLLRTFLIYFSVSAH